MQSTEQQLDQQERGHQGQQFQQTGRASLANDDVAVGDDQQDRETLRDHGDSAHSQKGVLAFFHRLDVPQ